MLTGDLTIRAVTRPAEFEVEFLGAGPTGLQGETRIGFSARGAIMRRDFGITFGLAADSKIVIGDKVDITLDIQAVLDDAEQAEVVQVAPAGWLPAGGRRRPVGRRAGPGDLRADRRAASAAHRSSGRTAAAVGFGSRGPARALDAFACGVTRAAAVTGAPRASQSAPRPRPTLRTTSSPPSPPPISA